MGVPASPCVFCEIIAGRLPADHVYDGAEMVAFLDNHPLFPGHVLLCPRMHHETLLDLPGELAGPILQMTQLIAKAIENVLAADGTFVAVNNRVSQTVPHLHIHVVPRKRGDGLKGFFWPRHKYKDEEQRKETARAIRTEVERLARF